MKRLIKRLRARQADKTTERNIELATRTDPDELNDELKDWHVEQASERWKVEGDDANDWVLEEDMR